MTAKPDVAGQVIGAFRTLEAISRQLDQIYAPRTLESAVQFIFFGGEDLGFERINEVRKTLTALKSNGQTVDCRGVDYSAADLLVMCDAVAERAKPLRNFNGVLPDDNAR